MSNLLSASHRATNLDNELRLQKLHGFINPVQQLWQNPELNEAIRSFAGFCDLMFLSNVKDYLVSRHVHEIQEWGLYQLDSEGQALQKELEDRLKVPFPLFLQNILTTAYNSQALPLRTTKTFLACSTDKIDKDTPIYKISCTLWRDALPTILPSLLKFLR